MVAFASSLLVFHQRDVQVLKHCCFVDFENRKVSFQSVEYFVFRFPEHCPPPHHRDELYDECRVYQSLPAIPQDVLCNLRSSGNDANEEDEPKIRADVLWHELEKQRDPDGTRKFGLLAPIANLSSPYLIAMQMKSAFLV